MEFCDTHAHLTFSPLSENIEEVIDQAGTANVTRLITVGTDSKENTKALRLAQRYQQVWAAVGIHPHDAESATSDTIDGLTIAVQEPRVVAVGEMGLDYVKGPPDQIRQQEVFSAQLEIAQKTDLPVIVHSRAAYDDLVSILAQYVGIRGVMHCFSGDITQAQAAIKQGWYIGITGIVTFPNAQELQEVVRHVPLSHILLETDCPYLAPQAIRGQTNEPRHLPLVAQKIAELKNVSVESVAEQTTANAKSLFNF